MKHVINSHNGQQKFPQTQVHNLLNDNLIVAIRLWSGPDAEQAVVDEILRFLSAADADLEVTTPFDYIENLSSLSNKVRIALLLANETLYAQNKEKYMQGYEIAICYKHQKEISVGSVGRFALNVVKTNKEFMVFESGGLMDDVVLLPSALLGTEREPEIKCASVAVRDLNSLQLSSIFDALTFWSAKITDFD